MARYAVGFRRGRDARPWRRFVALCDVVQEVMCGGDGDCSWEPIVDGEISLWEVSVDRKTGIAYTHECGNDHPRDYVR